MKRVGTKCLNQATERVVVMKVEQIPSYLETKYKLYYKFRTRKETGRRTGSGFGHRSGTGPDRAGPNCDGNMTSGWNFGTPSQSSLPVDPASLARRQGCPCHKAPQSESAEVRSARAGPGS